MTPYRRNLMVGSTVLIGLCLFMWMALKFSGRTAELFAPPQTAIHFTSPRADGLSVGSPIYFLGIDVGRVTNLHRLANSAGVTIDAQVDRDPPLPGNLTASIASSSAISGGTYLNLQINGDHPEGQLAPNATLPATYVGLDLRILPPEVTKAAQQFGDMSEEIRKTMQQFRQSGSVDHLNDVLKQVSDETQKLQTLTDSLKQNTESINKQVGDRLVQIAGILNNLQSITAKVDQGKGTAGELINDPHLYEALADTARQLDATSLTLNRLVAQWEQEGVSLKLK
jgi:phospholipid/cholesterol/gamma-HCH transport system substrate-binding protein